VARRSLSTPSLGEVTLGKDRCLCDAWLVVLRVPKVCSLFFWALILTLLFAGFVITKRDAYLKKNLVSPSVENFYQPNNPENQPDEGFFSTWRFSCSHTAGASTSLMRSGSKVFILASNKGGATLSKVAHSVSCSLKISSLTRAESFKILSNSAT